MDVEHQPWSLAREVEDFQDLDIGLYPMDDNQWTIGKSGLKSIQYMAVGVPFVASPVGAAATIGEPGVTHFPATAAAEWRDALGRLLEDPGLRRSMGDAGRRHVLEHYRLDQMADRLASALWALASGVPPEEYPAAADATNLRPRPVDETIARSSPDPSSDL